MKTRKTIIGLSLILIVALTSCAKVFYPSESKSICSKHKTLAMLPINFELISSGISELDGCYLDDNLGLEFRKILYEKLQKESLSVDIKDFQSVDKYFADRISKGEKVFGLDQIPQIAKDLNVDAVFLYCIRSNSTENQGRELALDVATKLLTGIYTVESSSEVKVITEIYDGISGKRMWQFKHWNEGAYFTTPMLITKPIIREVKNRFPYLEK